MHGDREVLYQMHKKKLLIEGEGLNKQGERVWIWGGGGSSALDILLEDIPRGNKVSETIDI